MKIAYKNENLPLELQLDDGATGRYPTATIRRASDGFLLDVITMSPGGPDGVYICNYVPASSGYIYITYKVYTSNLYNVLDLSYSFGNENVLVYDKVADLNEVADKIWDTTVASHQAVGSTGKALYDASINGGGGGGGSFPPELTVQRIENLDNLDVLVSTRATQSSVNSVLAALSGISSYLATMATNALTAAQVWAFPVRGLTETVAVNNIDISNLATKADLTAAVDTILNGLDVWETKGGVTINPASDIMELVVWVTKNGSVVLDPASATVELRDGDDNVVMASISDASVSSSGLFKFTRSAASAIIFKNRTYVMKISITRGTDTYHGNVSISTY